MNLFWFHKVMQDQKASSFVEVLNHNYGRPPDEGKYYPYTLLSAYFKFQNARTLGLILGQCNFESFMATLLFGLCNV